MKMYIKDVIFDIFILKIITSLHPELNFQTTINLFIATDFYDFLIQHLKELLQNYNYRGSIQSIFTHTGRKASYVMISNV